jgi:hypothetical protein
MHLHYPNSKSLVINSGPHDNRFSIENLQAGTEFYLVATYRTHNESYLTFDLKETAYQVENDRYVDSTNSKIKFSSNSISHVERTKPDDKWRTFITSQIFCIDENLYEDRKDYKNNS